MKAHHIILIVLNIIVIAVLLFYFFIPTNTSIFTSTPKNSNFIVGNESVSMQFYPNMRYPTNNISYSINPSCTISKKANMLEAFNTLENLTSIHFYPSNNPEINVSCKEDYKIENGMFIAGEGGPTNATEGEYFNVINHGEVLLIKDSSCSHPNVEIHELLHALGFKHSKNINNIMYPVSKCSQTLGNDIPALLNYLYSFPSYPDLAVSNASASINGRYLNLNFSVQNEGLNQSPKTNILVYADSKLVHNMSLQSLNINQGLKISLTNVFLSQLKTQKIEIFVENKTNELSTDNNKITLQKNS